MNNKCYITIQILIRSTFETQFTIVLDIDMPLGDAYLVLYFLRVVNAMSMDVATSGTVDCDRCAVSDTFDRTVTTSSRK